PPANRLPPARRLLEGQAGDCRMIAEPVKTFRVGTSGWSYTDWRPGFYPERLAKTKWFAYYASAFDTVEINSTFYGTPTVDTFRTWAARAPQGFVYALKAPRELTHFRPQNPAVLLGDWIQRARNLADHFGPILYQFPPWLV